MQAMSSLVALVREGAQAVPVVRYALGVVGLFAAAAIGKSLFDGNLIVAGCGAVLVLGLMLLLLVVSGISRRTKTIGAAIIVLVWFTVVTLIATTVMFFLSVFFAWPRDMTALLGDASHGIGTVSCENAAIVRTDDQRLRKVRALDDPDYSAFEFVTDHKSLDLTHWSPVPAAQRSVPISPATMTRTVRARKIKHANTLAFPLSTTGLDVGICVQKPGVYHIEKLDAELTGDSTAVQINYQIVFDVAAMGVGEESTFVYRVTYWNAFEFEDNSFFAIRVRAPTRSVTFAAQFPINRPATAVATKRRIYGEPTSEVLNNGAAVLDRAAGLAIAFEQRMPPVDSSYVIDWDW